MLSLLKENLVDTEMAGLALVLELLSKNPTLELKSLHSFASLSAASAATFAASTVGCTTLASQVFSRDSIGYIACCEEYIESEKWESTSPLGGLGMPEFPKKSYNVDLKPFFSAFGPKAFAMTTLRAFVLNFQPVLESYVLLLKPEEDNEPEEEDEAGPKEPIDYMAALNGMGRTILREVTVITTRRLLERILVQFASKRTSWKLLKDLSKSSARKAARHISRFQLFLGVTKTTFRGHSVAVAASWLVQLTLDIYKCIHNIYQKRKKLTDNTATLQRDELAILWRKIVANTLKCGAALVFASIGAGLGAVLIRPSSGQWIGCAAGEFLGALLMGYWIDSWVIFGTFDAPEVD